MNALMLKTLTIGPAVMQSPMSGWTDLPFRLIAREKGAGFAFLEMILADAVVASSDRTFDRMQTLPEDRPLGAQLVGYTPESIAAAARILEESGVDLIDLNFGCPVPKVTCKGGGSAMLRDPDLARDIFRETVSAVSAVPVTVKMRLGYDDPSGDEALGIAKIAEDCGIAAVTIHGRSRRQGYSGEADYAAIGRIKQGIGIPVIGNGDVTDGARARRLLEISGCDGIMIGRGGIGYPWIYREVAAALAGLPQPAPPDSEEVRSTLLRHIDLQIQYTPRQAHLLLRRIACGYFKRLPGAAEYRARINAAASVAEIRRIVEELSPHFSHQPCSRFPSVHSK
ncbi:tRNA dihydrouridine synthase DusB [bacterium]|nr:tRNA dihydrouridine synthase DusB [bacterium]